MDAAALIISSVVAVLCTLVVVLFFGVEWPGGPSQRIRRISAGLDKDLLCFRERDGKRQTQRFEHSENPEEFTAGIMRCMMDDSSMHVNFPPFTGHLYLEGGLSSSGDGFGGCDCGGGGDSE